MKNFYFIYEQRGGDETPPPTPKRKPKPAPKKVKTKTTTKTFTPVNISSDEMCNGFKEVSEGMKGDIVGYIQAALNANLNINLNEDDEFGEETRKAVAKFQYENKKEYNLTINGKVDKATYSALMEGSPSFACKTDVKKTTDVIKSTDVKPKIDEPNKMKKTPIPTGWTHREKYTGKIKEQVNPPVPQTLDNQPKVVNPQTILKRVIRTGCIDGLKKEIGFELIGQPESQPAKLGDKYAIIGFNQNDFEYIYLFSDGTGQKQKVDKDYKPLEGQSNEEFDWECPQLKQTTSLTADETRMSKDQQQFVNDIVANGGGLWKTEKPSAYEEGQGNWQKIDLVDVKGSEEFFSKERDRNKFFVWKKTGVAGKTQDYVTKITNDLIRAGYSFNEPDVTSTAYGQQGVLLGQKFPEYAEYFKKDQKLWYIGKQYSTKEQVRVKSLVDKINRDTGDKLKGEFCREGVDVLHDAANNPTKIYFTGNTDLLIVKNYVKRCGQKMGGLFGGSKSKFDYLMTQRAGTDGSLRFMLGEQKNNLNTIIKKKLVEAKTKKENDFIEKKLIENRLKMIVESIKKQENIVEKKNLERVSFEFINELKELDNQGLINENLGDTLKSIFGSGLETMPTTFFEIVFDKILNKLGLNDPTLKNELINLSKNNLNNIVSSFKDCESMTELIAKAITEILFMNLQSGKELKGQGWNLIRNILGQEIKKDEFLEKIKENLNDMVCQEFSTLTSNSQGLLSKIKGAVVK